MLENWIDPVAIGIVFMGTVAATLLRCGLADMRIALAALRGMFGPAFNVSRAKAELSKQIREIADDGFIRAEPHHFGDVEFDSITDIMIGQRSVESIHGAHRQYKQTRLDTAQRASRTFESAAELAPVLGLAGTLFALGQAPGATSQSGGLVDAIAMAVVTTLYGLVAANFLFAPIAAAIARRSRQEERDRDEVLEWLAEGVRKAGSGLQGAGHSQVAA
ncbi:MAG: MotA/TolQ/ExbB proton channel family protein [Alphaproteobacteria bacterium]|nr:MotA/TolQ/ExbB proton channel family protein [Alphaproteobacteria bacterium]